MDGDFKENLAKVFPTHVGVYRKCIVDENKEIVFSPRTWGCTFGVARNNSDLMVFPTHVGVYLIGAILKVFFDKFSPRTWGCTAHPTP